MPNDMIRFTDQLDLQAEKLVDYYIDYIEKQEEPFYSLHQKTFNPLVVLLVKDRAMPKMHKEAYRRALAIIAQLYGRSIDDYR